MPPRRILFIVSLGIILALLASLLTFIPVRSGTEINDANSCEFQPPAANRAPTMDSIRIDAMISGTGNITKDNTYTGLHRWNVKEWPGVDYLVPTTVAFKNGGKVRMAAWDSVGGGYSLFIDGTGPCEGWYIFVGHLDYNPAYRYQPGQVIGPDEIIGEPGCSGFEANCDTRGSQIPKHNHYTLGHRSNIFAFADGTVPAYVGGYYWIHPSRVEGSPGSSQPASPAPVPSAVPEMQIPDDSNTYAIDPATVEGTGFQPESSLLAWTPPSPFLLIPIWAYIAVGVSIPVLFVKKIRLLGFGGIISTTIIVVGLFLVTPNTALASPPQVVYMNEEDLIDIPHIKPTPDPNASSPSEDTYTSGGVVFQSNGKPSDNPADYPLNQSTPCEIVPGYSDQIMAWCGLITYYAKARGLDPNLIAAVLMVESYGGKVEPCDALGRGNQVIDGISFCSSVDGAIGMMQIMPSDGISKKKYGSLFYDRPTSLELLNPETNLAYGTKMLKNLGAATNPRKALFHYGPATGTYEYADLVLSYYNAHH